MFESRPPTGLFVRVRGANGSVGVHYSSRRDIFSTGGFVK